MTTEGDMSEYREHVVQSIVTVTFGVREGSDAITRVTGSDGDDWRATFYDLYTPQDVFEMWADNAIRNGVRDISQLDGWGDLDSDEVTVEIEG